MQGDMILSASTALYATPSASPSSPPSPPPPSHPAVITLTSFTNTPSSFPASRISTAAIQSPPMVDVVTVTATATSTKLEPPSIVYQTVFRTQTQTILATSTSISPTVAVPTSTPTAPPGSAASTWSLVSTFTDAQLSSQLAVSKWEWGQKNVVVTSGIPSTAWLNPSATPSPTVATAPQKEIQLVATQVIAVPGPGYSHQLSQSRLVTQNKLDLSNDTVMAVLYPKGSINPANKEAPTGGTGMYMTPLDLSHATNVSLEYSVFFPADFDFVKGGKLPGLYGGHAGCSGGEESEDCFSTRIMFRPHGQGELYLYVPKSSQPAELCQTPPLSYCETTYGLSIGRGAWTFERGAWTNIRQEIRLNTPGVADGGFNIFINDVLALTSSAVMFRKDLSIPTPSNTSADDNHDEESSTTSPAPSTESAAAPASTTAGGLGGLLGGVLGGVAGPLGGVLRRDAGPLTATASATASATLSPNLSSRLSSQPSSSAQSVLTSTSTAFRFSTVRPIRTLIVTNTRTVTSVSAQITSVPHGTPALVLPTTKTVKFVGIMFDTFFGGNSQPYASTKDQYTYFNRVALKILS